MVHADVVDPFHVVRLANQAVTRCRQRTQQATLAHRGWKGDPLYDIRKLLLLGAERVDARGWSRLHAALAAGDPRDEVADCWVAKEKIRDVYRATDAAIAAGLLDDAIAWCSARESGPELATLAKTLRHWRAEILAHHTTGASNGPVEAANLLIKQVKRSGRGFRSFHNYRLRILLAGGQPRARLNPSRASAPAVPGWSRRATNRARRPLARPQSERRRGTLRIRYGRPTTDRVLGCTLVGGLEELGVEVERRRGVGVAEAAADGADVDAGGQELRGAEVAEVVELHAVEAELVAERPKASVA